jgi:hypothetical protein
MLDGALELIIYICVGKYIDLCSAESAVFGQGCRFVLMLLLYLCVAGEECGSIYIILRALLDEDPLPTLNMEEKTVTPIFKKQMECIILCAPRDQSHIK